MQTTSSLEHPQHGHPRITYRKTALGHAKMPKLRPWARNCLQRPTQWNPTIPSPSPPSHEPKTRPQTVQRMHTFYDWGRARRPGPLLAHSCSASATAVTQPRYVKKPETRQPTCLGMACPGLAEQPCHLGRTSKFPTHPTQKPLKARRPTKLRRTP